MMSNVPGTNRANHLRRGARRPALLASALLGVALSGPASGQVTVTPLVYPGAPAPYIGPGVTLNTAGLPTITSSGEVFCIADILGPGVVEGADNFVVLKGFPASPSPIVRSDTQAPGLPAGVTLSSSGITSPFGGTVLADDAGGVCFSSTLEGAGVVDTNNFALWMGQAPGFSRVIREDDPFAPIPGAQVRAIGLQRFHNDTIVATAGFSGPGITTSNDAALIHATASSLGILVREGTPVPTIPVGTLGVVTMGAIGDDGRALFRVTVNGGATGDAAVFLGTPGNLQRIARVGEQAPDLPAGVTYQSFAAMDLDGRGSVAFQAMVLRPPLTNPEMAIFFGPPGALECVAAKGQPAPGLTGVTIENTTATLLAASQGSLIFKAGLGGTGVTSFNNEALFHYRNGQLTLIARKGAPVPEVLSASFGGFVIQPQISREGSVLFQTSLAGVAIPSTSNEALFLRKPDGSLTRLLRKGDSITFPAGGSRTVTGFILSGRSPNAGLARMVAGGKAAVGLFVRDPSTGEDETIAALIDAGEVTPLPELAWTIPPAMESNTNSGVHGTSFEPTEDIEVTKLGYYDDLMGSPEGLNAAHPVGIYHVETMQLVVSATVPAGTVAPRENLFRFVDVPPTLLRADQEYIVAAVANGDNGHNVAASEMVLGPGINLGLWRAGGSGPNLSYPNTALNTTARFMGPSFQYRFAPQTPGCPADLDDDGSLETGGNPDGAVTIDDLLFFLAAFEAGDVGADLDGDGMDPANPDGAVTVDDLLFMLAHFEAGC